MGEIATLVSATTALIAIIFAVVIHYQTRNLMKRTERPIVSLVETQCKIELSTMHLNLIFKNIGKNPAKDLRIAMAGCPKQKLASLKKLSDILVVNRKDPGTTFTWGVQVGMNERGELEKANFLFYILVAYSDMFDLSKVYRDPWYLEYKVGERELTDMRREDYLALKPYIKKIHK